MSRVDWVRARPVRGLESGRGRQQWVRSEHLARRHARERALRRRSRDRDRRRRALPGRERGAGLCRRRGRACHAARRSCVRPRHCGRRLGCAGVWESLSRTWARDCSTLRREVLPQMEGRKKESSCDRHRRSPTPLANAGVDPSAGPLSSFHPFRYSSEFSLAQSHLTEIKLPELSTSSQFSPGSGATASETKCCWDVFAKAFERRGAKGSARTEHGYGTARGGALAGLEEQLYHGASAPVPGLASAFARTIAIVPM